MSESSDEDEPKFSNEGVDFLEYLEIIEMLDHKQHLNVPAHLYSAFLIKSSGGLQERLYTSRLNEWTAWPLEDAPAPPQIYDEPPDDKPKVADDKYLQKLSERSHGKIEYTPDSSTNPKSILERAFNETLGRIVNSKIHNDPECQNLEPILDPEPKLNPIAVAALVDIVDKYTNPIVPKPLVNKKARLEWNHLGIEGAAGERLKRLFMTNEGHKFDEDPSEESLDEFSEEESESGGDSDMENVSSSALEDDSDSDDLSSEHSGSENSDPEDDSS